jgi:hypothetical protein
MPLAFLTLDTRMSRFQATKLPSKKGLHKVDLHCWRAWRDLSYSAPAQTFFLLEKMRKAAKQGKLKQPLAVFAPWVHVH